MGKEVILPFFVLPGKFSNNDERRAQDSTFCLFSSLSQDLLDSFEKFALCRRRVILP